MFSKVALLALTAASVNALTFITPTDVRSATPLELAWNFQDSDPFFTIELSHPSFRADFALANNVDPGSGGTRVVIPVVLPRDDQYVIRAVNVTNINQEYARTSNFFVGDTLSTSGGSTSTVPPTSSATNPPSGATTTGIPTNTNTNTNGTSNTSANTNTNTNTGTTNTNTNTNTNTRNTNTGTSTGANGGVPTNTPNNGALSIGVSFGAAIAGAVAAVGLF